MGFVFEPQEIPAVVLIRRDLHRDGRGTFSETFKESAFRQAGLETEFVQDNLVHSSQRVLRGMHYQLPPAGQGKLVAVLRGRILDVAVDLQRQSRTYGRWVATQLTAEGGEMLWVPRGFAHGYVVLSLEADVTYKVTFEYAPELDRGIRWDDPDVGIHWPFSDPVLSDKDRRLPLLRECDNPF